MTNPSFSRRCMSKAPCLNMRSVMGPQVSTMVLGKPPEGRGGMSRRASTSASRPLRSSREMPPARVDGGIPLILALVQTMGHPQSSVRADATGCGLMRTAILPVPAVSMAGIPGFSSSRSVRGAGHNDRRASMVSASQAWICVIDESCPPDDISTGSAA